MGGKCVNSSCKGKLKGEIDERQANDTILSEASAGLQSAVQTNTDVMSDLKKMMLLAAEVAGLLRSHRGLPSLGP